MSGSWSNTSTELVIIQAGGTFTGLFVYSPTIGAGNLIASIAAQAGTDPYNNSYVAGIAEYDPVGGVFAALSGGGALFGQIVTGVPDTADASTVAQDTGLGLKLQSFVVPASSVGNDRAVVELLPGGQNKSIGSGQAPITVFRDSAGNSPHNLWVTGNVLRAAGLNGQASEVWQAPASFTTGWAAGSGASANYPSVMFRKLTEDNIWIFGAAQATAATPSNTVFTLPAGYRPQKTGGNGTPAIMPAGALVHTSSTDGTTTVGRLNVQDNGAVVIGGITIASGDNVYFNHIVPLGNIS